MRHCSVSCGAPANLHIWACATPADPAAGLNIQVSRKVPVMQDTLAVRTQAYVARVARSVVRRES